MKPKTTTRGGVEANSVNLNNHSNRLVLVRYKDHVKFKNTSRKLYFDVNVREAVGWLTLETEEFLFLLYDRSVEPLPNKVVESGLILIKSDIVEVTEVK